MIKDYSIVKSLLIEDETTLSKNLLQQLSDETDADYISLHFISLLSGDFELFSACGEKQNFSKDLRKNDIEQIIDDHGRVPEHINYENKLVIFITRKKSCLGFLEIHKDNLQNISEDNINKFDNISTLLLVVYERRFINNMLKKVQEPINFEAIGHEEFFNNIINMIKVASGMRLIAVREFTDEKDLICLGASGFGDIDISEFNFTDDDIPNEFLEVVIDDKTVKVPHARDTPWISNNPLLNEVQSFIAIPIRVGSSIFGVLSFATTVFYHFSNTEILALESIANGIGVSISNFRNVNKSKMDIARFNEIAVVLTGLEIAQATRHEAKNKIDNCQYILANLLSAKKERISEKVDDINELSHTLKDVKVTLDKIKTATKPPIKTKEVESVRVIWDQAVNALSGRLSNMDVNIKFFGKEPRIEIYSEWLRHAFLNLLLNSMDAFKRGGKKKGRSISLSIDKFPDNFSKISMVYQDNAGGIDIKNMEIPIECIKFADNLNRLLFAPNVTSKGDEGSGWGLFLVRKGIEYHKGSIDLIKHRGGVSFKIELHKEIPKDN